MPGASEPRFAGATKNGSVALDADDVRNHVRANLARFKVPREVFFVDAVPYTPTGKVARRELAALTATP